jgi:hypothetical protein
VYGSAAGDYFDTHSADGLVETLTEERYTGGNKKSRLEHQWSFDLSGQTNVEFVLTAEHLTPGDPDDFLFELSSDGGASWSGLLGLTTASPAEQTVAVSLPGGTGNVLVRAIDTDNSNDRSSAQLRIDQMVFRLPAAGADASLATWSDVDPGTFTSSGRSSQSKARGNDRASLVDAIMAGEV